MKTSILIVAIALTASVKSFGDEPTFYRDVLPIFQAHCQRCHRPGEVAPMSLVTYEASRPYARAIKLAVSRRQMPPWFADPGFEHFSNERRLTDEAIATITRWADVGAPAGDPTQAPPPLHFENGWNIKPDVVVEMPKAFDIPARGTINYKYVLVKTSFKSDMWVVAAEMRPGNPAVLHHGKVWVRPPGSSWMSNAVPGEAYETETQHDVMGRNEVAEGNDILGKFNPGLGAQRFDVNGAAKFIPKGSDLVFELHYTSSGERTSDVSKVGFVLAKAPPQTRYYFNAGPTALNLAIPPGDSKAEVVAETTLGVDVRLAYAQPHMHLRGRDFELRLVLPDGQTRTVLKGDWNFEWQLGYEYQTPILMPKGTRMQFITHFDNSLSNRFNPDATKQVVWGPQNWDEMSNCWIGVLFDVRTPPEKVFLRSGPSLLRRGDFGPTLAQAATVDATRVAPATNGGPESFEGR